MKTKSRIMNGSALYSIHAVMSQVPSCPYTYQVVVRTAVREKPLTLFME